MAPVAAFFVAVVVVSLASGPLFVALLFGAVAAFAANPLVRNPPWTRAGRSRWRQRAVGTLQVMRFVAAFVRAATRGPNDAAGRAAPGVDPQDARVAARFDAVLRVRCEAMGDGLQIWHAPDSGRAYQVHPNDAPSDAQVGTEGWLSFDGGRARVRSIEPSRVLN
jgi:hypothetical protein